MVYQYTEEELANKRKEVKAVGLGNINMALEFYNKMICDGVTANKIDVLNILLYKAIVYLNINLSRCIESNGEFLKNPKLQEHLKKEEALAIYELGAWKRVNDFLEHNVILNVYDSIEFLRNMYNYINDMYVEY